MRKNVIWASNASTCVRTDAQGNIYIADNIKLAGNIIPPELEKAGILTTKRWEHGYNWYPWMYGSVVKFPPAGGAVKIPGTWGGSHWGSEWKPLPDWQPPAGVTAPEPVACVSGHGEVAHLQNACWLYPGISSAPGAYYGGCVCFGMRFDVDGFGRVFIPDVGRFCVHVVDAQGNPITRFGEYGNMDSAGPDSAVPVPEIAFAWPQYVGVSEEAVYVSDVVNRRIVRVTLRYEAEATCEVRF